MGIRMPRDLKLAKILHEKQNSENYLTNTFCREEIRGTVRAERQFEVRNFSNTIIKRFQFYILCMNANRVDIVVATLLTNYQPLAVSLPAQFHALVPPLHCSTDVQLETKVFL